MDCSEPLLPCELHLLHAVSHAMDCEKSFAQLCGMAMGREMSCVIGGRDFGMHFA